MTDDERREEDAHEETASSPEDGERAERSAHDVSSPSDRVERWADPESRWGNPEKDLPNIPRVRIPGQAEGESLKSEFEDDGVEFTADVDPEQTRLFWGAVVLANVGIAGVALGAMLIYFRGQTLVGLGAILLGVGALSRVYAIYREYSTTDWSSTDEDEDEDADGQTGGDADGHTDTDDSHDHTDTDDSHDHTDTDERNR